jgi:hypothetical protein
VPLRPLGVGDILSGAFTLLRANPAATLGLSAIVLTIYATFTTILQHYLLNGLRSLPFNVSNQSSPPTQAQLSQLGTFGLHAGLAVVIIYVLAIAVQIILTGALTGVLGRSMLGCKVQLGQALSGARLLTVLGVAVLQFFIFFGMWGVFWAIVIALAAAHATGAAVAFGLAVGIPLVFVTVWIYVNLSLAVPAAVLEQLGPWKALRRSWQLVKGSWWRVFGISLLGLIVVFLTGAILSIPFNIIALAMSGGLGRGNLFLGSGAALGGGIAALIVGAIGTVVSGSVTRPIGAGVTVLLYGDMRMRKEGFDLTLQQASQHQQMTGDEFMATWRPPVPGSLQAPAAPTW